MPVGKWFRVQSIGTIHRGGVEPDPDAFYDPWEESVIEVDPRWALGLEGIEGFSHLVVLFYLDRAKRRRAAGKPRAAEAQPDPDAERVGFLATRTPERPNPIGISCPRLLRREGNRLIVTGFDAWPGTPVLDIKGYFPRDELRPEATVPAWLTRLNERHDSERGKPAAR